MGWCMPVVMQCVYKGAAEFRYVMRWLVCAYLGMYSIVVLIYCIYGQCGAPHCLINSFFRTIKTFANYV